jgi:perosamine synthetase
MKIPLFEPNITEDDVEFVKRILEEKQISGRAPIINELEKAFSNYLGVKHAIACSSGTAALHLAMAALGIGEGDEVIAPTFTMMSPIFAILYTGAKPVLIDADKNYWTIEPLEIERKISKKTKAILVVHIYGNPVDIKPILEVAEKHDLYVIEDCAEALGATYYGKKVGTLCDIATFSFYANKLITSGEGGMVTCKDYNIAEKLRSLRDLCFGKTNKFLHEGLGYNYRLSALQAALCFSQLKRIEEHLNKAKWIAKTYTEFLENINELYLHQSPSWGESSYWMYSVVVNSDRNQRNELMNFLAKHGIETRQFFVPAHRQPLLYSIENSNCYPNADFLAERGLNLPSGLTLTKDMINSCTKIIKRFFKAGNL